jgi:4-amino-4-deoxy-L-arabinose transferase-like glycosyltransferase
MVRCARWWLEWEFWAVLLLAGLIYGTRLSETPPGGEEPRRGQVAREMFRSGDWIVPRQQGLPFLSRPPVQNWAIALCSLARGKIDAVAIRFPSVMAILLTVTLIYAYGRTFLARLGAMSAMAAFATMGLVLQFGWLGETEALYTFVVAASFIVWRWADARHKPPLWGWCGGYGLAALGMLTKGPQAPAYFLGGVAAFLLAMRRGRELFRWQHAVGVGLFFAVWLAWEIPFYLRVGPVDAWTMFSGDIGMRFQDGSWIRTMRHFVEFPLSVAACTLPWGVLLLAYVQRDFRRGIAFAREDAWFLGLSIGVASLSCYLVPGARNRYLAPVLPLAALLIGLAAQQCYAAGASDWLVRLRRRFFIGMGLLAAGLGTWIVAATVLRMGPARGQQPASFAIAFALAAAATAATAFWASTRPGPWWQRLATLAVAGLLGLAYSGAIINIFVATRHPIAAEVATVAARVPEGVELVSIGPVDDVFLYYYGKPIRQLPAAEGVGHQARAWTYFCMGCGSYLPEVDMPYEKLGAVSVEAAYSDQPHDVVIIGRRLPEATAARPKNNMAR